MLYISEIFDTSAFEIDKDKWRNKERDVIRNKIVYINLNLIQFVFFLLTDILSRVQNEFDLKAQNHRRLWNIEAYCCTRAFSMQGQYFLQMCIVDLSNCTYVYIFLCIYARVRSSWDIRNSRAQIAIYRVTDLFSKGSIRENTSCEG